MNAKKKIFIMTIMLVLAGLACGQLNIGIESPTETSEEENTLIPAETGNTATLETPQEPDNTPASADYWKVVKDSHTGVRFAIPCFWEADIPESGQETAILGDVVITNFSQAYLNRIGPDAAGQIWSMGGATIDLTYLEASQYGLSENASLEDFANVFFPEDGGVQIKAKTPIDINGQAGFQVITGSESGDEEMYLISYAPGKFLMISAFPADTSKIPDFQAILQSFAVTEDRVVQIPDQMPADPPKGMGAPCLGIAADETGFQPSSDDLADLQGTLDCNTVTDEDPLVWVVCNVQAVFISRNTQPLANLMGSEFLIGYWQSEGRMLTNDQAMQEIQSSLISPNPGNLTFTTDRALFPPLYGMQPEQMFDPAANIVEVVYSEGWGPDGNGAAILVFSEDQNGEPYFYGMVVSFTHFDK